MWLQVSACVLAVSVLVAPALAATCPASCVCSTSREGLHRAVCSNLAEVYKYSLRQKHHNINVLDLSHNNISRINHELDRLTEIVALDLSTNGITDVNKFLHNSKKLVHLNLANNRIRHISAKNIPTSVSSLDITNNLLKDVPSDLKHLTGLEHLELEGNPLDCSCENIRKRDSLLLQNVFIDKVKCAFPEKFVGYSWLELKTKEICKMSKSETINLYDMMMGDQPIDAERIGEETTALKSMSLVTGNILEEGNVIKGDDSNADDDSVQFLKVNKFETSTVSTEIEGSGGAESTTISEVEPIQEQNLSDNTYSNEEMLPAEREYTTDDPLEGSGEGSGLGVLDFDKKEKAQETTTPMVSEFDPGPVRKYFDEENSSSTEFPLHEIPNIYAGGPDWHTEAPVTEKVATPLVTQDTTVSQKLETPLSKSIAITKNNAPSPHKTGTYVCIAIIVVLLVGLIGFAIAKGQIRKRRDRRLLRQQKRDIEKASKEMVDMNQSLLGKPAIVDNPTEKKANGKYELVPTHEPHLKKSENGDIGNGVKHSETNGLRTDSPRDSNQNKNSSKDNNLPEIPVKESSFETAPSPDSGKDRNSLDSEDIFVPINDEEAPKLNGNASDISQPLLNGDQNTDSDFLSPSREYVPVYSPDMGRVRIKMTETPKPKTPVLVTRSRSNAGDIIITPALGTRKSTT